MKHLWTGGAIFWNHRLGSAPNNLQGIAVLPGGVAVGFSGKELMFSEPYHLYAWPAAYRLAVDYEIQSLPVAANRVIIVNDGYPYVAFGIEPSAMTLNGLIRHTLASANAAWWIWVIWHSMPRPMVWCGSLVAGLT